MKSRLDLNKSSIYTYEDFNRLEDNCIELQTLLANEGKIAEIETKSSLWSYASFLSAIEMDRIVSNVQALKTALGIKLPESKVPALPALFGSSLYPRFDYSYFDKIEKNLYYINGTIVGTKRATVYAGTVSSGNVNGGLMRGGV